MGSEIGTGFYSTTNSEPDMTFVWNVTAESDGLLVQVNYGPGTGIGLVGSATIPWGETSPFEITDAGDPEITVNGGVTAIWGDDGKSYVVTFSGAMIYQNVNTIASSNLNGAPGDSAQIIVCAYLD